MQDNYVNYVLHKGTNQKNKIKIKSLKSSESSKRKIYYFYSVLFHNKQKEY